MKPAARIQAAVEVLEQIQQRHQPASIALSDWGKAHRFAGSGDRSAIGNHVYDALRHRAYSAYQMRSDSPRSLVLGMLANVRKLDVAGIRPLFDGAQHAPTALTGDEFHRLTKLPDQPAAQWQLANIQQWLEPHFVRTFGPDYTPQAQALAERAPVDLRANTLKADRAQVLEAMAIYGAVPTDWSDLGVRIAVPANDGRTPNVEADAAHGRGWFEVQDEGSQIAAAMSGAKPGDQVLDLCAGAGGKTLAIAARLLNEGNITAYDADKTRLRPIFERLIRAGVTNVDVLPAGDIAALDALGARFDIVLVDAPCSGSGTWRRKPDAKWRLKPDVLAARGRDQQTVLARAARQVKPGGRLVYVTCSLLAVENGDQVAAFLTNNTHFKILPWRQVWGAVLNTAPPEKSADGHDDALLLTPASHNTDGFFICVLERAV